MFKMRDAQGRRVRVVGVVIFNRRTVCGDAAGMITPSFYREEEMKEEEGAARGGRDVRICRDQPSPDLRGRCRSSTVVCGEIGMIVLLARVQGPMLLDRRIVGRLP